ncbi:MAG: protein-L-isoaspartate(D-aspartate) O-methyltransferase [Candidatus Aminicenantes bacterium]|nr:protein-L-isoaspartate(D-aspartate) O-methyltransferase [Candidatus Aminicenantes bacterium]
MRRELRRPAGLMLAILCLASPAIRSGQTEDEAFYAAKRKAMVETQLKARDIKDPRILEIMGSLPRQLFVGAEYRRRAYEDYPLPIDEGQTISQPYIVALMTQALGVKPGDKVLEVGTGSGYQAAVLSRLARRVYSIDISVALTRKAGQTLAALGCANVEVKSDDGYFGWVEQAPFDAVMVTCAARQIPPPLIQQLKEGGRLVIPLEETDEYQSLKRVTKTNGKPVIEQLAQVRFVPMLGQDKKKHAAGAERP